MNYRFKIDENKDLVHELLAQACVKVWENGAWTLLPERKSRAWAPFFIF